MSWGSSHSHHISSRCSTLHSQLDPETGRKNVCSRHPFAPTRITQSPEVFSGGRTKKDLYAWETFSFIHCSLRPGDTSQKWIFTDFHDFQDTFSPKKPGFEWPDNMELQGPSVVYNFQQKSAWDVHEWLVARVLFLSKMKVDNPLVWVERSTSNMSSYHIHVI
jgi:hypothetical protein